MQGILGTPSNTALEAVFLTRYHPALGRRLNAVSRRRYAVGYAEH
jgi:hypothetical protein